MYLDPKFIQTVGDGKLYIMGKPSGGENLQDDISHLKRQGITGVVSLLEQDEESGLGITEEGPLCAACDIHFISVQLVDRGVPRNTKTFIGTVVSTNSKIIAGGQYLAHCRAGIGRSGLFTSAVLMLQGLSAIDAVSKARGFTIPDTQVQIDWLQDNEGLLHAAT